MSEPRIVRVEFELPRARPAGFADPMPRVLATFDDGVRKELFDFYPDEITFGEGELVGLTKRKPALFVTQRTSPTCPRS